MKTNSNWSRTIPLTVILKFLNLINSGKICGVIALFSLVILSAISTCDGHGHGADDLNNDIDSSENLVQLPLPQFEIRRFKRNLTTGFLQNSDEDLPLVTFFGVENDELNASIATYSILASLNERYDVTCEAPYLTELIINFPITRTDKLLRTRIVSDSFDNNTFIYRSIFYFFTKIGTTGSIVCQCIENKNVSSQIHIFTQAGKSFVEGTTNLKMKERRAKSTNRNSFRTNDRKNKNKTVTIIPCPSNYALLNPQLTKVSFDYDGNETYEVIPANYDPKVGFSLVTDGAVTGADASEYKCVAPDDQVNVKIVDIAVDIDESDAELDPDDSNQLYGTPHVFFPSDNGRIFCIDENNLPTKKRVAAILCDSQPDCDLHHKCYGDIDNCTAVHLKGEECVAGSCAVIDESHSNGAVICESGSMKKVNYYFTGFDKRRYKTSEYNISRRALVYMDKVGPFLYTDEPTFFFCEAISFIFVHHIQFAAVLVNGTEVALAEGESYRLASMEQMRPKLSRGTVQKGILMNVTEDMKEIVCMVPWYNSSDWLKTSTHFRAKKPLRASINKTFIHKIFYVGEYERTLTCSAKGEPMPTFQWFFDGEEISERHFSFSVSDAMDGKSTLRFPVITGNITGEYTCMASNRLGNDTVILTIFARDTGLTSGEIWGAVLGTGMLLAIICFGFVFIWKKYITTKKKLRKLTNSELDEFENGNPEALSLGEDGLHNHAMFLPFNKQFVIKDPDLVVDRKGVLGKGSYGVVLRGRYLGDPVAVKTTLPSADVFYFKALMAEVKIMAYIGHHKNVVTFVGAVTSNIRQRMLYIVVELSPFGNLEAYLKDHRSTFINFIQGNDIVKPEFTYMNVLKRISSLDLINWCAHIAAGMEYLASKKVIHGDLATRNLLLFPGDVVKITDFGLSRQLYEQTTYVKKQQAPLPWRWMAIESLRDFEFSTETDVWAYGVTLWELFTLAEIPYPGYSFSLDLVEKLEKGLRMKKPKYASDEIFEHILNCWHPNSKNRSTFEKLREFFTAIWYKYSDHARAAFGTGRNGVFLFSMEPQ